MIRRILLPLDGSPLSERGVPYVLHLAERHGAEVVVLHVEAPHLTPIPAGGLPIPDAARDIGLVVDERGSVERIVRRMRKRSTVPIDVVYREGRAAQQIAEYCREAGIDLAVMCTHGRGGFSRFWLGSTADGLLRQLAVPTLLIRGTRGTARSTPSDVSFPRILVPLDRSPHAEAAMHAAIAFAGETAVTLTLLSVIHPMTAVSDTGFPTQAEREYCAQYLEPLAERYRHEGRAIEVETEVTADVAQAIIDHANRHASSLIALATQGLGGVQRFVIGSVADKLIRTAPMPVLVVP